MSHRTLVNGTAYEIGGGKTLIGGTAYSIDKGKTLVGGTAYEVGFAPPMATVTINFSLAAMNMFNNGAATLAINGTDVDPPLAAQLTYSLNIGDTIWFLRRMGGLVMASINGEVVSNGIQTYEYSVKSNAVIEANAAGSTLILTITEE